MGMGLRHTEGGLKVASMLEPGGSALNSLNCARKGRSDYVKSNKNDMKGQKE